MVDTSLTLSKDEQILYRANFHWLTIIHCYIKFFIIMGCAGGIHFIIIENSITIIPPLYMSIIIYIIALCLALPGIINIYTTHMIVTSTRFIYKKGFIKRRIHEIALNRIETIDMQQSLLGRIFDYGSFNIVGTGNSAICLPCIDAPLELRKFL